jgi:hypothetical protein
MFGVQHEIEIRRNLRTGRRRYIKVVDCLQQEVVDFFFIDVLT